MFTLSVKILALNTIVCTALLTVEIHDVLIATSSTEIEAATLAVETVAVPPTSHPADLMNQLAARTVARPLFAPSRRPPSPKGVPGGTATEPPRLSGIISWPGGNSAIFQPAKASHPTIVGEGETMGEWKVQSIVAGTVTVSRGDQRLLLHPSFADAPVAEAPEPRQVELRGRDQWGRHIHPPDYLERRGQRASPV
jgi:hypothetical protein